MGAKIILPVSVGGRKELLYVTCIKIYVHIYGIFFLFQVVKAYRGSRGILHAFLTSVVDKGECLTSRSDRFTPWKELRYTRSRRLSGQVWTFGRRNRCLATAGVQTPDHSACSLLATPTELFCLLLNK